VAHGCAVYELKDGILVEFNEDERKNGLKELFHGRFSILGQAPSITGIITKSLSENRNHHKGKLFRPFFDYSG